MDHISAVSLPTGPKITPGRLLNVIKVVLHVVYGIVLSTWLSVHACKPFKRLSWHKITARKPTKYLRRFICLEIKTTKIRFRKKGKKGKRKKSQVAKPTANTSGMGAFGDANFDDSVSAEALLIPGSQTMPSVITRC